MKTVCKKLLSLTLVAMLLVSAMPFQALATETAPVETTAATEAPVAPAAEPVAEPAAEPAAEPVVETTAATEAPVAPVIETVPATESNVAGEDIATQPAVNAINDETYIYFVLQDAVGVSDDAVIKEVKTKIGAKVSGIPGATEVMKRYSQIFGSDNGKRFDHWELNGNYVNPSNLYVTDTNIDGDGLYLYAILTDAPKTIVLNPNGGVLANKSHSVFVGEGHTYGELATLPVPTRTNYTFGGWFWKNSANIEVQVTDDSTVYDTKELKAQWILNDYVVNYQRYEEGTGWVDSGYGVSVAANSTVSAANGTFPTDAQIAADFALNGFSIVGWEIGETDTEFKPGATKVTGSIIVRPRYQRTVILEAQNPVTQVSWSTRTITVEIGEQFGKVVKTLPNPGARDSYTFNGWLVDGNLITVENLGNYATHPIYYPELGDRFLADFIPSMTVYLYIHTNGNTQTATKIVPYYQAPAEGTFDMTLINMYSIFSSYGDYDDTVDESYGWYTAEQWERYSTNKSADAAMYYDNIQENRYGEFHIMLINKGTSASASNNSANSNGYNNNSSTADSSNYTTGDMIFMAITVLAVSGAALALIFLNKKRKVSE